MTAQRPEHDSIHCKREHEHDSEAEEDREPVRQSPLLAEGQSEPAGHDQLPVCEVDEPKHSEDETDPDSHERIDPAELETVRERGPRDVEVRERHER